MTDKPPTLEDAARALMDHYQPQIANLADRPLHLLADLRTALAAEPERREAVRILKIRGDAMAGVFEAYLEEDDSPLDRDLAADVLRKWNIALNHCRRLGP